METLLQDLKYGARLLARSPGFTLVAVLTLALGIGSTASIFSLVDGMLLDTVPFEGAEELVFMTEKSEQFPTMSVSYPNFADWRDRSTAFSHIAAHRDHSYNVTGLERPVQAHAVMASADMFAMLGVEPLHGRVFSAEEDRPGSPKVAVLAWGFWQRHLGGDRDAVNRTISLDGEPYTVLGVMPQGFVYPLFDDGVALWLPMGHFAAEPWMDNRGNHPGMQVTARLASGVSAGRAREEMETIAAALASEYPDTNTGNGITLTTLQEQMTEDARPALLVLSAGVGLVLLIACVNVANLLLARAAARGQEVALRSALGAGGARLVRQLLTESVLLSLAGGLLGLGVAYGVVKVLAAKLGPEVLPPNTQLEVNGPVLAFTFAVAVACGLLFGLAPALTTARTALASKLRDGARTSAGARGKLLRGSLVVVEVAFALVLLVGAALFLKSFERLTGADPGVVTENLLTFELVLPEASYPERAQQADFIEAVIERVEALPGVVAASNSLPVLGGWQSGISVEGQPLPAPGEQISSEVLRVGPGYRETLGLRLLSGRWLEPTDREDSVRVAVVDETFAEKIWPGEEPLGRRFLFGRPDDDERDEAGEIPWIEVVGVVNHVKSYGVHNPSRIQSYLPLRQNTRPFTTVLVKTEGDPMALARAAEDQVLALDPNLPVANPGTLEGRLARRIVPQRLAASLLSVFAGLAVVLAGLGIYGVMAYAVNQRRQEIGVRMALGANQPAVLGLVVRQAMLLALVGVAIGLAGALAASLAPVVRDQLFQVSPRDPSTFLLIPGVLALVALLACAMPARRAARGGPIVAVRYE